jgi:hypothetical protein
MALDTAIEFELLSFSEGCAFAFSQQRKRAKKEHTLKEANFIGLSSGILIVEKVKEQFIDKILYDK